MIDYVIGVETLLEVLRKDQNVCKIMNASIKDWINGQSKECCTVSESYNVKLT